MIKKVCAILACAGLLLVTGCARRGSKETAVLPNGLEYVTYAEYIESSIIRYPFVENGFRYTLYDKCAVLTECLSAKSTLSIPGKVKDVPVIGIRDRAFANITTLTEMTIGPNVLMIGSEAFYGCTNLAVLNLSGSINQVESNAFAGCRALNSVVIPAGLSVIPSGAFRDCTSLKRAVIESTPESGSKSIGFSAFGNCNVLEAVWLPPEVTEIASDAFSNTDIIIFGQEKTEAAVFASDYLLDFVITERGKLETAIRSCKIEKSIKGADIGTVISADNFKIKLTDIESYAQLGDTVAGDKNVIVAATFAITNTGSSSRYFDGFGMHIQTYNLDMNGELIAYEKCPIMLSESVLGSPFPAREIPAGKTVSCVVAVEVNREFKNVTISFADAGAFVIR